MTLRELFAAATIAVVPVLVSCGSSAAASGTPNKNKTEKKEPDAGREVPASSDIEFSMETTIDPGAEAQVCRLVQVPDDRGDIAVPSAESHFTAGSHHFLAYRTSLTSMPEGAGDTVDCLDTNAPFVTGSYFESQQPDMTHALPPGIAHVFKPGSVIVLQAHYLNTTTHSIDAKITFTMHTMDPGEVEHEAGTILFSNFGLKVPPFSKVTQTRTCPVSKTADMNVLQLWSHMHRRAVHFVATTDDAALSGAPLYETDDWSEPQPRIFDATPTTVHIGSHITFSCDFDNPTDATFVYGPSAATNEMCILHGMYWPRVDALTEFCVGGAGQALPPGVDAGAAIGGDAGTRTSP